MRNEEKTEHPQIPEETIEKVTGKILSSLTGLAGDGDPPPGNELPGYCLLSYRTFWFIADLWENASLR